MRIGKLTNEQLKSVVLSKLRPKRDVLLRSGVGEDCAALDFQGQACVLSTDPITGAEKNAGRLAVHVSCNDVASSGAEPEAMLVTLLIPPGKTMAEVESVIDDLTATADMLGVDIIGGHTEVTDAVNRIVLSTTVIGRTASNKLVKSGGAMPGDTLIMTGCAASEGTYIIASERSGQLAHVLTEEELKEATVLGGSLSVISEGIIAGRLGATAMHDVTEGGVFGAVHELCEASGTGCDIRKQDIPILDVTKKICAHFGLDPYRLIGSGSMLITAKDPAVIMSVLDEKGISAAIIGTITVKDVCVIDSGKREKLAPPEADELFRL